MFPVSFTRLVCSIMSLASVARPSFCSDVAPLSTSELRTFTYVPATGPAPVIAKGTALQFNGSYPGQGDVPGQLGWFVKPYDGNEPKDLISFVQYNADAGVVFWAERTAFEVYLSAVAEGTYAVKLGQPWSETPEGKAGNWTINKIPGDEERYGFGWKGDYESWFVCEGKGDDEGFYGLYFGEVLEGCGSHFVLEADYEDVVLQ